MKKAVIADAGPLIALARIGQLALLPQLFGEVVLTDVVAQEITGGGAFPDSQVLHNALAQPWLQTVTLPDTALKDCHDWIHLHQVDMGEASALVLATACRGQGSDVLLILDETRGRQAAAHAQLAIIGTAGMLILAKNARLLTAVRPSVAALQAQHYFLSARLVEAVLRQAGEV